jgi:hypothetical protein
MHPDAAPVTFRHGFQYVHWLEVALDRSRPGLLTSSEVLMKPGELSQLVGYCQHSRNSFLTNNCCTMMRGNLIACLIVLTIAFGCSRKSADSRSVSDSFNPKAEQAGPNGPATRVRLVQADVRRTLNAVYGGDIDTVLRFTHPDIIQQMGGALQAKTVLQKALDQIQTAGMKVESLAFPEVPTFTNSTAHEFVVVPTKLVITVKGQRLESLNYQFGVREVTQTNWAYIEGSRITAENVRKFFPDFPLGFEFPKVYRKKL